MTVFYKHLLLDYFLILCCILNPQDSTKENALGGSYIRPLGRVFAPEEKEHELKRGEFPFAVMIQMVVGPHKERVCSGSIVTKSAVITSSACLVGYNTVGMWAGNCRYHTKEDFDKPTQGREVSSYKTFGEYFGNSTLAWAVPDKPFDFTEYIKPVGLYREKVELEQTWHDDCYVVGFGISSPVVDDSRVARFMVQTIWSRIGCKEFPPPQPYMCATHDAYNKTICEGDIGGPVLCPASPGKLMQFGLVDGRIGMPSRIMDLDCLVPQEENRYLFVGHFHAFLKEIPDLPKDGPSYPPLNRARRPMEIEKGKEKQKCGARRLKVSVQVLCATITSSILETVKFT